jgi:hypothetical protein
MRISSAIVIASTPPFHLATALAEVIYPTLRVFVDTDCIQIPGQCGGSVARIPPQIIHLRPRTFLQDRGSCRTSPGIVQW